MKKWLSLFQKWLPLILTVSMAGWFVGTMRMPKNPDFAYNDFGSLPVVSNGRTQPLDSLARNSLLLMREKQTINLEPWKEWYEGPKILPATEWLANVMMNPALADTWPVFRIDNPELVGLLKLPEKDKEKQCDGKHYSWNQIQPSLDVMDKESKRIGKVDASSRNAFERAVMKTHERLVLYMQLRNTLQPQDAQDWARELAEYRAVAPAGVAAARAKQAGQPYDEAVFTRFLTYAQKFDVMARFEPPMLVPPSHPERSKDDWARTGDALLDVARGEEMPASVGYYATMASAFRKGDSASFNKAVDEYHASLNSILAPEMKKAGWEQFFNQMQPFYAAMVIYVLAFLLACGFWFNLSEPLRRSAVWLIVLGFVIHTTGLILRMWINGRPPVTNLYSSAIFIGWGSVVLGLILERFYRDGIGSVVATTIGFSTLIIAHTLSMSGDTMEMMRAVLDTNFWLATHVVVVTLGYASTYVAGFLALVYILRGMFTKTLSEATGKSLARMVYGIVCFATLFSFVGTVLGGIWADQSWGRFWGWDPKENGALIIVLWNALILHLRWGGMVRERGLINCAIIGNIVTSWSWFGVNMLGIGLHSYGFMDSAFKVLVGFILSQLVIVGLGLLPNRYWLSFQGRPAQGPATPPKGGPQSGKPAPAGA